MTRQDCFKAEFYALLRKYDVEITVKEGSCGYATTVDGIEFWSYAKWDNETGDMIAESIDFTLSSHIDGKGD